MGVREHREVLAVVASPTSQPSTAGVTPYSAEADTLELAEPLELHRDGFAVIWPVGWGPVTAAVAIYTARGCPVGPFSRPEFG